MTKKPTCTPEEAKSIIADLLKEGLAERDISSYLSPSINTSQCRTFIRELSRISWPKGIARPKRSKRTA
jgi:hypothetical protein